MKTNMIIEKEKSNDFRILLRKKILQHFSFFLNNLALRQQNSALIIKTVQ